MLSWYPLKYKRRKEGRKVWGGREGGRKRVGSRERTQSWFIRCLLFQVIYRQIWEINLHTEFAQALRRYSQIRRLTSTGTVQQWNRTPQSLFWNDLLQHQLLSIPQDPFELEKVREIWLQIQMTMYCADTLMCKRDIPLNYLHLCVCLYIEINYLFSVLMDLVIQITSEAVLHWLIYFYLYQKFLSKAKLN